jgi:hypothetical protein
MQSNERTARPLSGSARFNRRAALALALCMAVVVPAMSAPAKESLRTQNVVLIVMDGLRWQEMFTGADPTLLNEKYGGIWASETDLRQRFWSDDPAARRRLLFPFIWDVVAKQGQIWGNQNLGSIGRVTNAVFWSYPGYSEMSIGFADPQITTNEFGPNPNMNVFEWLNARPEFTGKVAIFGNWPIYRDIFNTPRSHLYIQCDTTLPHTSDKDTPRQALLRRLYETTTLLDAGLVPDSFVQVPLLDYVKTAHPRVLFVGYGDTDEWAHSGRYDLVLEAAHHADAFAHELWDTMQAMPEYRNKTTFIITADHGRGSGLEQWKDHGVEEPGSENIWIAVIGPDTAPAGEHRGPPEFHQAQIAATIARLLGTDFQSAQPKAAAPLPIFGAR